MTPEEKHLWYDFLKYLPCNVYRQKVIGNYIVDFYIAQYQVVIELDGIQHTAHDARSEDEKRDRDLANLGITVLRYPNDVVRNDFRAVTKSILNYLNLKFDDLVK